MQLEYLDGVFEEIDSEESREISGGEEGGIIVVGIIGILAVAIGKGLGDMANNAYEEQTKGGTLADLQQHQHGGGSYRR